ncbi:hypothetical protein [Halalkalibacterium ligniniphilum]|uniref:hypothetical protein n=1 Tax=Halalkalibacterium ligniniphilum TaxID=1134413 RepID=UPI00034C68EA|nr:hypothetical protein [Halalkalibacterium ligniniphilum]
MAKKFSITTAFLFTFFLLPLQVALAAGNGEAEEAAHAEPSGFLISALAIMSFATLIVMIYYMFRDNG